MDFLFAYIFLIIILLVGIFHYSERHPQQMFFKTIILFLAVIYTASAIIFMSILSESIESVEKNQKKSEMEENFFSLALSLAKEPNSPEFLNIPISNPFNESKNIFTPLLFDTGSQFFCVTADIVEKLELSYVGTCDVMYGNARYPYYKNNY